MSIPTPNLDDRDFLALMDEALQRVRLSAPKWTDFGPGEPGRTLLEAFAHLTEVMIYRLNRVPDKAYRTYLGLMGVRLWPPQAAQALLRFTRADPEAVTTAIPIPRGTRVTVASSGASHPPVFVVPANAEIPAGESSADVTAYHCDLVDAEQVRESTGEPGQSVLVARPPMVSTPGGDDLVVAVEAAPGELNERTPAIEYEGVAYRIWREVPNFADLDPSEAACVVDRTRGIVTFAPSVDLESPTARTGTERVPALALVPAAGRRIRVWYRTGGGPQGNVATGTLTVLVDDVPGVEVTNPGPATGGRGVEAVENALVRGPQEFHAHDRAVTARDYELIASRSGAISRARAFAQAEFWTYAAPGSVQVVLVPHVELDASAGGRVQIAELDARATDDALAEAGGQLDRKRPLGIETTVTWARLKQVRVRARVGIRPEEDEQALRTRVLARLHRTVNPLPAGRRVRASEGRAWPGWPFGQPVRVSDVYDILLAEPGVVWADRVRLHVDDVPGDSVSAVAVDPYQPSTWYAARGGALYRSLNDCVGWEPLWRFEGETVTGIEPHPREPGRGGLGQRPGYLAVITQVDGEDASRVYVSRDLGETWGAPVALFAFPVEDLAWIQRDETPSLLLATEQGLYEQALTPDAVAVFSSVDPRKPELGFYQVDAYTEPQGNIAVVLAAQEAAGIYRSKLEGRAGTFLHSGLEGRDIRTLAVQYEGTATFLWGGAAAEGESGQGCFRARLEEADLSWEGFGDGWEGGSCWGISFVGEQVFGASHNAGVQRLSLRGEERRWWRPAVNSGLPLREMGRFHPVTALAAGTAHTLESGTPMVMAAGPAGVYRSVATEGTELGEGYEHASRSEFDDAVTLPPTWLFVSGDHDVEVVKGR